MINRGDIKLAIDMVVNAQDDNLFRGEAEYVINTLEDCGNTIAKLREQVAAQAAVIERLSVALNSAADKFHDYAEIHSMKERTRDNIEKIERNLDMARMCDAALSLPTDSTQILDEVRRAERERVAQYVQQGTGDWMLGKKIAEAIRAME